MVARFLNAVALLSKYHVRVSLNRVIWHPVLPVQLPARIVGADLVANACSRQRWPRSPFSDVHKSTARLFVTKSVRVSLRHDDEHVNYYRQGSLAKLQWRPMAIEFQTKRERTRGQSMMFHQQNWNRSVKRIVEWPSRTPRNRNVCFFSSRSLCPCSVPWWPPANLFSP